MSLLVTTKSFCSSTYSTWTEWNSGNACLPQSPLSPDSSRTPMQSLTSLGGHKGRMGRTCYFMLSGSSPCSNYLWLACCDLVQGLTANKWQEIHPQTNFHAYRSEIVKWISEDFRNTTMCAGLLHCPIWLVLRGAWSSSRRRSMLWPRPERFRSRHVRSCYISFHPATIW